MNRLRLTSPLPLVLAAAVLGGGLPARGGEVIDKVLATVDARAITQSAFDLRLQQDLRQGGKPLTDQRPLEIKKVVMGELVDEALLEDRAGELGLLATDADVEEFVKNLREKNGITTEAEFVKALAVNGLTPAGLREQLRRSVSVQRVVGREVYGRIALGDDVLRLAYEREKETWRVPEQARISEILIPAGEGKAGEAKALEAARKLKSGTSFEEVVLRYSTGAARERAGDLGLVSKGELTPEIDAVVFSLPPGGVSGPIATKSGWHIVKVAYRTPARYRPFDEVRAEVLKKERDELFPKKLAEYLDRLKRAAVIKVSDEAAAYYTAPVAAPPAPREMKPTTKEP